jgi:hypothetical protein
MALHDHKLNNKHYLHKAFDPHHRVRLVRTARRRRSIYLVICFIGVACVAVSGVLEQPTLTCLSLLLSTLSIVVVTKYDTQVFFLTLIDKEKQSREETMQDAG